MKIKTQKTLRVLPLFILHASIKKPLIFQSLHLYVHEYKGTSVSFEIHTCTHAGVRAAFSTGAYELSYDKLFSGVFFLSIMM